MKYFIILLVSIYQLFISPLLKTLLGQRAMCRFSPSCSAFAKQEIKKHGIINGGYKSIIRLLSCQPYIVSL